MIVTEPDNPLPERYPGGLAFGKTIRARRIQAGLTLRTCAERLGIYMSSLSLIEQGQREMSRDEYDAFNRAIRNVKGETP